MLTCRTLHLASLILCGAIVCPLRAVAQGVVVNVYPREAAQSRIDREVRQATDSATKAKGRLSNQDRTTVINRVITQTDKWFHTWNSLENEDDAARLWAAERSKLLPAATVSPGTDRTALYTELAHAISGGWRFALSTALAVQNGEADEAPVAGQDQEVERDTDGGFRRFLV